MECSFDDCDNQIFKNLDKCALHCEKRKYENDYPSGILIEFNHLLKKYIFEKLISEYSIDLDSDKVRTEIIIYRGNPNSLSNSSIFKEQFAKVIINFSNIYFPSRKDRDSYDYFKTLEMFGGIHFSDCKFSLGLMNLKLVEVFYEYCLFTQCYSVVNHNILDNTTNSIYSECDFIQKLDVHAANINDHINCILFHNCIFRSSVSLNDTQFAKEVFVFEEHYSEDILNINIERCIFEDKVKLNGLNITNLNIEDVEFKSKFEIKGTTVKVLILKNSNVEKVFDAFDSKFEKFYFYKSILTDFAGFERVEFGLEGKDIEAYQARFIYTTFMSFSNFRNTKFLSGLDFSTVNLKQEPNFLNTYVHPKGTDRETFRIIKNSFEKSNNKIEAGNYHAREMSAYIKELSFRKNFWQLTVLYANNLISRFGQSYIIPFSLLIGCVALYSYLLNSYQEVLQFRKHEMQYGIEGITEWLNTGARNFLPFARFISDKRGFEFVSLIFYIAFAILTWQTIVAVKKQTQH